MNEIMLYFLLFVIAIIAGAFILLIIFTIKSFQRSKFSKKLRKVQESSPYRRYNQAPKPNPEQRIRDQKIEVMSEQEYQNLKQQGKIKTTREKTQELEAEVETDLDEVMRYDVVTGQTKSLSENKSKTQSNPISIKHNKQIVGLAKNQGFWSRFIMGQKLGFIMARLQAAENKKGGFWANLIKAQSMSQGKNQSRGR